MEQSSNNGNPISAKTEDTKQIIAHHNFQSALGQRISREYQSQFNTFLNNNQQQSQVKQFTLNSCQLPSPDFLRLPPTFVKLRSQWVDIRDLEQKIIQCHLNNDTKNVTPLMQDEETASRQVRCVTRVIHDKDPKVGLGMSLREYNGCIYVQAVLRRDGTRIDDFNNAHNSGPAFAAGLRPGDRLLGLNGTSFLRGKLASPSDDILQLSTLTIEMEAPSEKILKSVGDMISRAAVPLVIHYNDQVKTTEQSRHSALGIKQGKDCSKNSPPPKAKDPYIHPFAKALCKHNLIQQGREEQVITQQIRVLCDRTRQWESKLSFRLRASDYRLRPQLDPRDVEPTYYASFLKDDGDAPPFFSYKYAKNVRTYAPSTPMIEDWRSTYEGEEALSPVRPPSHRMTREAAVLADLYAGLNQDDQDVQDLFLGGEISTNGNAIRQGTGGLAYSNSPNRFVTSEMTNDIIVPLIGVRKAICVRIVNTFLDSKSRTAFSIWCYDVESGMEWYAPVRYHEDFKDLRLALLRIDKSFGDIHFPNIKWGGFGLGVKEESASSRELRRAQLESWIRKAFAVVYRGSLHPHLAEVAIHLQTFLGCDGVLGDDVALNLNSQVAVSESTYGKRSDAKSEPDSTARMYLKRSVQRYVYRIFLLPSIERLIAQFIEGMLNSVNMATVPNQKDALTKKTSDIEKIRDFIDQVQELILEGCHDDLTSMALRRDFAAINDFSTIDDLIREAVREQVELEIYIPLRTTISKHLVNVFYNEDLEMKHKLKALENKPQSFYRIKPENRSRSDWRSVCFILKEGVGRSSLPSVKLRAIVDAAKEIVNLYSEERGCFDESIFDGPIKSKTLGADDFLPIFIFCFVQARLDRPCALCELLQTMCDPLKLNGETGYYLASFHAAMTHIGEIDLTEDDELSIFLDILPD